MMIAPPLTFPADTRARMCEELISSCSSAVDPYRRSMTRLLEYVGIQQYGTPQATVPPRTQAENNAIAQHLEAVKEAMTRHEESVRQRNIRINKRKPTTALADIIGSAATAATAPAATGNSAACSTELPSTKQLPTIYLSFEDSAEWKAFLMSIVPEERLAVTVRRRLTVELWRAHQRDICLWCWFPCNMCMCTQLDAYKAAMPARVLDQHVEVTMLLHSEELMRSTNSGHIAAYLLGAPIRVWGMDADDLYLRELDPCRYRSSEAPSETSRAPLPSTSSALPSSTDAVSSALIYTVSLYPSSESIMIDEFIRKKQLGRKQREANEDAKVEQLTGRPEGADKATEGSARAGASHVEGATATSDDEHFEAAAHDASHKKVHLILLDSTWGQALSLNRKLSRFIPRVKLEIPESYEPLFQALRKRTRQSGVSTLEATSMAVEQCVRSMGYAQEATQVSSTLMTAMKNFVDARCLLKYAEAPFTTDGAALDAFRDKRDDARRGDAARWQFALFEKMQHDADAQRMRLPPVLNYCYCCDCVVGWHRMPEHVMGRGHRTALVQNPDCTPSAASRLVEVPDFSRPPRAERTAEWKQQQVDEGELTWRRSNGAN
ncbi:hypothetical protein ABL78_4154 [Leptomonas seymouri]|uniref:tRNA-uridine aminocarboxypropyltransferase n=1 Tax=Leptomonas seymouri TaxID=5684 RepID=A0A0N1I6V5_LEPSE|nr:hypothetical protein ABL78_4154 [Leptomonas seymouri]|eukprot:KPI86785.1 hypothetical protein ABL78_4154 [Leptomonas seymouri]